MYSRTKGQVVSKESSRKRPSTTPFWIPTKAKRRSVQAKKEKEGDGKSE